MHHRQDMVADDRQNGVYMVNMGYTRDLDERKDTTIVVPERDNSNSNYLQATITTTVRRRRFYRRGYFWCNIIIVLLFSCFILTHELNIIPHFKSGFYCGDPKISFPFTGDTISIVVVLIGSSLIPTFFILVTELFRYRPEKYTLSNVRFKTAVKNFCGWYKEYFLTLIFNLFFIEVVKGIVGEPRPHFLETCQPDAAVNCTPGMYIPKYICLGKKHSNWFTLDSIKSFPSGHTSIAVQTSIFMFWYFQKRLCDDRHTLIRYFMQMLMVTWGIICSFTRITDNRHHWWDVLVGAILGVVIAHHLINLCKSFECPKLQLSRSLTPNGDSDLSVENHNPVKNFMSTTCVRSEEYESGKQIT